MSGTGTATTEAPGGGGLSTDTIIIIVGSVAGGLFVLVVLLVCVVACYLCKNKDPNEIEKGSESTAKKKEQKQKKKKKEEPVYRDRIFRPVDWNNPEGPEGGHDITEIDQILFEESRSRRGSIAFKNPAFKDDGDEKIGEHKLSNGHAYHNGDGPPRLPNLDMLPPITRQQSHKSDDSKPYSSGPHTPTTPKSPTQISILDQRTWGAPDITADIRHDIIQQESRGQGDGQKSNGHISTVSAGVGDPQVDFSVFGNMRGSALQENNLRRSFKSRSQAIVDFYESGYSNSMGQRSAVSLPMSRMDNQIDSDDHERPVSGYGTGNKMLWQKRTFLS